MVWFFVDIGFLVWERGHSAVNSPCFLTMWPIIFWIVRNHVELYCAMDTGNGLGRSLGDCKPALPKGQKYQMVKKQTESHDRRPLV